MSKRVLRTFLSLCLALSSLLALENVIAPSASAALTCARGGTCVLGDTGPGGGKVFNVVGTTYLEATPNDLSDMAWETVMGVAANSIYNGITGWRLPTLEEAKLMNQQRTLLNFTSNSYYWTSSETTISQAYIIAMTITSWYTFAKTSSFPSRPIRSFSALTCANGGTCAIGDTGPGGGKVFYSGNGNFTCGVNLELTCSASEVAISWTDVKASWSSITTTSAGVTANAMGRGLKNSQAIITQPIGGLGSSYAASIARAYTGGGKTDWYLPTYAELTQLTVQRNSLGTFQTGTYVSSTEDSAEAVASMNILTGWGYSDYKNTLLWVRPIRSFIEVGILSARTLSINAGSLSSSYSMAETPPTLTSTVSAGAGSKSYSSSTSGVCTVDSSSGTVAFVAPGTCTITAAIDADSTYSAVSSTSRSFTIAKGLPELIVSVSGGTTKLIYRTTSQLSVQSNIPGRFTLRANGKPISGCINVSINATRNCNLTPSFRGSIYITIDFIPNNMTNFLARSTQVFNIPVANRTSLR